jgi:hypothetical protein
MSDSIATETTLADRYEAIHTAILAGPNAQLQLWVDSGVAWLLEGHVGRVAGDALAAGALVLGPNQTRDYWGSNIPAYTDVVDEVGSSGSVANAEAYDPEDD